MEKLPIRGKIWKTGKGGHVITIPKIYIDNGWVQVGESYDAFIEADTKTLKKVAEASPKSTKGVLFTLGEILNIFQLRHSKA